MRKEFNELVETMKRWDLFQKDDEVDMALNDLGAKIDEVEKRIECAVRSAKEINESISKYTEEIDDELPIKMSVNDHDLIQNCSDDVRIALDLNDDMSIVDNWYDLFQQPTKEEPIAVGNIEYDFPEEVFTIGNVDNTEIIGDIYESTFLTLCDLNVIICEGNERFPIGHGKTNYVITNKNFTNMVKNKQIDLSKVPIKKKTFMSFESSWGNIACDEDGNVIEVIGYGEGEVIDAENYLFDIVKFDLVEYGKFCESINITMSEFDDILIVGFWKKDGTYEEADMDWRKNIFGEEEVAPTVLCKTPQTHEFVKDIIAKLKVIDVDGETMEYILEQVGMQDQMLKQLFTQTTNDDDEYAEGGETGDDENFEYWIYQNYPTFDIDTFHLQEFLEEHYENSLTYNENFKNLQEWLDDDSENDDMYTY